MMNTTPGLFKLLRLTFLIASALLALTGPPSYGQALNRKMLITKKIRIPQTDDSLTFLKDSVYQVMEQVKTGPNAGIDKLLIIPDAGNTYAVSLINFNVGEVVETADSIPSMIQQSKTLSQLTRDLTIQQGQNRELSEQLILWQSAAGVSVLLAIVGFLLYFKKSQIPFRNRREAPSIDVVRAFEKALLKTRPALLEAIRIELADDSLAGKSKIAESEYLTLLEKKDALASDKKKVDTENIKLKSEIADFGRKLTAAELEKQKLKELQGEFTDISSNPTLVSFALNANRLLHTLQQLQTKVIEFAQMQLVADDPLVLGIISNLFLRFQAGFLQKKVDDWSLVIREMNRTRRVYAHGFLKPFGFQMDSNGYHADEFIRIVRKELFREYLSQSLILCETLANLSTFEGVSRSTTGPWENAFKSIAKNLVSEASQAGIKIQYIELGTPLREVEKILGTNWERKNKPEWPFDQITIAPNTVVQILNYGYLDTPGIPDEKTKIVLNV